MTESIILSKEDVKFAKSQNWGKQKRSTYYASIDGKPAHLVDRNVEVGNIGESIARQFLTEKGYDVAELNFKEMARGKWDDDIKSLTVRIKTEGHGIINVDHSIYSKSQDRESAEKYGLSWTFQLPDPERNRSIDPILLKPKANILLICSKLVSDYEGEVYCFYWPEVSSFLAEPVKSYLKGKKIVLYYNRIKDFECNVLPKKKFP